MRAVILLLTLLATLPGFGVEVDPISVRVEQISGNASNRFKHSQSKALKIYVSNAATADAPDLKVKYYYFGRSLKSGEVSLLKQGESKTRVSSHATVTVETPEIEATYTDDHGKRVDPRARGLKLGNAPLKDARFKVEAEGTKLIGYGVMVYAGNKLVAETFSEPGLKANVK
jgi:hypothetical protein